MHVVAILMAQATPANAEGITTGGIVDRVVNRLTDIIKAATQAAVAEIKLALTMLTESSMQIVATPTTPTMSLDARVHMREGIKARQVLVDALTPSQQLHQAANNTQLVTWANEALCNFYDLFHAQS